MAAATGWTPVTENSAAPANGWTPVNEGQKQPAQEQEKGFIGKTLDNIQQIANEPPSDTMLDSYSAATRKGAEDVRRGVAQGLVGLGHMVAHPIDTIATVGDVATGGLTHLLPGSDKASGGEMVSQAAQLPKQTAALVKNPPTLKEVGQAAGETGGNVLATTAVSELAGKGVSAAGNTVKNLVKGADAKVAAPIKAAIPEAAMQPDKAVAATDKLVRAAAPTATDMRARVNFHVAAGDLAEVADKVKWDDVRGGKALTEGGAAPDMRPRAVLNAVNERMGEMYASEVEPKMQAMEGVPARLAASPEAYKFLATTAGDETVRSLATKAAEHPEQITVPEAYQLSRAVNSELNKFESLSPDQQYQARTTNPAINQLDGLDESLNKTISGALKDRGLAGIDNFNRRYAAMASVRRALSRRVNAAELQRQGTLAKIGKGVRAVTGKNVNAIASASQASLADVNIGDQLEKGLKDLKSSGVKPQLDAQPNAPNLSLRPSPGRVPPPRQEALGGTGMASSRSAAPESVGDTHQVPGPPAASLSSPGSMEPAAQRPFSFMETERPNASGDVYPGGKGLEKTLSKPKAAAKGKEPGLVGNNYLEKTSEGTNGSAAQKTSATRISAKDIVEKGGGQYVGQWPGTDLHTFNSPKTGSTLALKESELTPERVRQHIAQSDSKFVKNNASGESAASAEAQSRVASNKANGTKLVRITRSGQEVPVANTVDAVDQKAQPGEQIVKRYADGREEIQDTGRGFVDRRKKPSGSVKPGLMRALGGD